MINVDEQRYRLQPNRRRMYGQCLLCLMLLLMPMLGLAQQQTVLSSAAEREKTLSKAQQLLAGNSADDETLMSLRQQLVVLRDAASEVAQSGNIEARAVEAQLESLGPPPAKDEAEPPELANRRSKLQSALARANAPVRDARETVQRAELLIREIDGVIRSHETRLLLTRNPSPLRPTRWVTAFDELGEYVRQLQQDIERKMKESGRNGVRSDELLQGGLLVMLALLLVGVVQPRMTARLEATAAGASLRWRRWLAAVASNLTRLALPGGAMTALLLIIPMLNLTPVSARAVATGLPLAALFVVMAHWLGHTLFAPTLSRKRMLPFNDHAAHQGVRLCQGLGLVLAAEVVLESVASDHSFSPATLSVLSLPIIVAISLLLWRLAFLFLHGRTSQSGQGESEPEESIGLLSLMAVLMRMAALLAPLLVLLGFVNLARQTVVPLILTLAELGIALFVYHLILLVIRALGGNRRVEDGTPSLMPILIASLLVVALLPLLALTWGARFTDIAEVWYLLTNGVQIGEIRLSLDMVIMLVAVFSMGMLLTRWLQRLLRMTVLPRTRLDSGAQTAMVTGVGYLGMLLAGLIAVSSAGLNLSSLAVVAGALSVGIGFGLQTIVSNFVSGIILLIERPIKEGDWIEVSGYSGIVRKIAVRSTRIETFDRHDVIVPNSDLIAGTVKNMTLSSKVGRLIVPVGVAYGSDLQRTREILLAAAQRHATIKTYPAPTVLFMGLGDSALNMELRCFLKDVGDSVTTQSDLLFDIYAELNKANIEIPFPQRDLHLRDLDRLLAALQGSTGRGNDKTGSASAPPP